MFPQLNVHIITSVDPTKLVALAFHKFWLKDVGTNMCVPQYPFLIFPPKVSYTIIFKVSWALACNLCLGIWGLGHIVTKKITYEIVYYLRNVYETKNIARFANAVQVTICLLVSTSVY